MVLLFVFFLLFAVSSLAVAGWVVMQREWHWGFRALLAVTTLVIGFALIVWFCWKLSQLAFN